jgi:RND family efflux transporter MFP subunit
MNTSIEHHRRLAETLKSLSLESVTTDIQPPKRGLRRRFLVVGLPVLTLAAGLAVILTQPEWVRRIDTVARTLPGWAGTMSDDEIAAPPQAASTPQDVRDVERSASHNRLPTAGEVTGSGFVIAPRMSTVFSKYAGRITQIAVELGDSVEAGQILVRLDDAQARFALEQAWASKVAANLLLAARTIDHAQARSSLIRTEALAARNAASRQQLEDARTVADRALNAVAQAKQDLANAGLAVRIAEEPVAELTVRAPFAGIVTRLDAHVGDTVLARVDSVRESQSLITITDTTHLVIDADVAETNIAPLRPGLRGEAVLDAFPDHPFSIQIVRLAPIASPEKGTIALRLSLTHPPTDIRPNMAARIRIPLNNAGGTTQ